MARFLLLGLFLSFFVNSKCTTIPPFEILQNPVDEDVASLLRNGPEFRLPTTIYPVSYDIWLSAYFDTGDDTEFTFDGVAYITILPQVAGQTIINLHANDLTIYNVSVTTLAGVNVALNATTPFELVPELQFFYINTAAALVQNTQYLVTVQYSGNIQGGIMRGFYRSWYYDAQGRLRWMGSTQFQPGHARRAFPCFDEPSFKATFTIHMERPIDYSPTISNMPIANIEFLSNTRTRDNFRTTPIMSTYLIAFIVSTYVETDTTDPASTSPFTIWARDSARQNGRYAFEVGVDILSEMQNYTNIPYYAMGEDMKMAQAAIPDFAAGAMENWGLLTYREALILYDDVHSSDFYKQRIANIISHEVAHMWFGNLVTCDWWDVLWINEGFARYYQYYLTHWVDPSMGFDERFVVEQIHTSMFSDSLDSAAPLSDPSVNEPTAVSAHFSTITYNKGAAVIRMTEHLMGETSFHNGLRSFLIARQYSTATPSQLFAPLQTVATADNALANYPGVTIQSYYSSWTDYSGFPLITVTVDRAASTVTVTQSRFERSSGVSAIQQLWQVPITYTRQSNIDFINTKPDFVLLTASTTFNLNAIGANEWIIFNKQETGFYRVNYDTFTWDRIAAYLLSNERNNIHIDNRAMYVDDVFAFARAGLMTYPRAFELLEALAPETGYGPWYAAISGFSFIRRRLAHEPTTLALLEAYIRDLLRGVTGTLGFAEQTGETFMEGMTRMYVAQLACNIDHEDCIAAAVSRFSLLRNQGTEVPANLRSWVYCAALRSGTYEDYICLWNRYQQHNVYNEKIVILDSLGCTASADGVRHFLQQLLNTTSGIRVQDFSAAITSAVTGNERNTDLALDWLIDNVIVIDQIYNRDAINYLSVIAGRLITEAQILRFEQFVQANQGVLGTLYASGLNLAATARSNLQWTANRIDSIHEWLNLRIPEDIPTTAAPAPTTTVPVPITTTAPEVTTEPNSAVITRMSIAIVSIMTLVHMLLNCY